MLWLLWHGVGGGLGGGVSLAGGGVRGVAMVSVVVSGTV